MWCHNVTQLKVKYIQEQYFLEGRGASVGVYLDSFNFKEFLRAQELT